MVADLTGAEREAVVNLVRRRLGDDVLPASIVTDRNGAVLSVVAGIPTVSELRRLLAETGKAPAQPLSSGGT